MSVKPIGLGTARLVNVRAALGTGLGLSISKDIVDNRHHGHLDVRSEPGARAQFLVKLPLETTAAKTAAPAYSSAR